MIDNSYKMDLRKNPKVTVREVCILISKQLGIGQRTVSNVISEYKSNRTGMGFRDKPRKKNNTSYKLCDVKTFFNARYRASR